MEGSIGPVILEVQYPYSNRGEFRGFEGLFGETKWFDTMIRGSGSIYVDLLVMVVQA